MLIRRAGFFLAGFVLLLVAQRSQAQYAHYKALYIYHFCQRVDWPVEAKTGDFVITVLGKSPISEELRKIARIKKVVDQPIVVHEIQTLSALQPSHIVLVAAAHGHDMEALQQALHGQSVLLITDHKKGWGSGINFVEDDYELQFEIDPARIQRAGLKVSRSLISLGILIQQP